MKKALLFLFMTVFTLSFNSCSSDDDNGDGDGTGNSKVIVSAEMKFKSGENYLSDVGGQLYHFKDFSDYVNYNYKGKGVFEHKTENKKVTYTTKGVAGSDGIAKIEIGGGQRCLIVWESGNIEGKYGQNVYDVAKDQQPIKISQIYFSETSQPSYK